MMKSFPFQFEERRQQVQLERDPGQAGQHPGTQEPSSGRKPVKVDNLRTSIFQILIQAADFPQKAGGNKH